MKIDKFYKWMEATNQNFLDPTQFEGQNYTCNECGELLEITEVCECLEEEEEQKQTKIINKNIKK